MSAPGPGAARRRPQGPGVSVVALRTPTLPPATHTNAWLLGEQRLTVVDPASPWPEEQQALAEALADREVERIFLTHHHPDHIGGVVDLAARTGAPIFAHPATAARVPFPVDVLLDEGDTLHTDGQDWAVLHTPGHASGHLCLWHAPSGQLVAGDMVAGEGTIVLDPPEGQLGRYLDSLARLRALAPTALLPAHGPAIHEAVALLGAYIAHRHMRSGQILRALADGPADADALAPRIYPDLPPAFLFIGARQILCHLEQLAATGQVRLDAAGQATLSSPEERPS